MIGARGRYRHWQQYRLQVVEVEVEDETFEVPCLLLDFVDDLKKGYFGRYDIPPLLMWRKY